MWSQCGQIIRVLRDMGPASIFHAKSLIGRTSLVKGISGKEGLRTMHAMHAKSLQLHPTLCNDMDCSPPGSSVHGIPQARILKWVAISFSREFSNSGIELGSPAVQAESLLTEPSGNQTVQGWDFMDALLNRKEAEAQRRKVMCLSALSKSATEFK